mgnify:CR=1 FL=1|tara:strand:+ start:302 stop:1387 length:1086 start_codon:yes stop_codon:yes gene_type:complete
MIKIKLYDCHLHRNETTFRPYVYAHNVIRDIGIQFITEGDSYDYAWIGQASIIDKKLPLNESIANGVDYISKISGKYMIVDGQDSTSLIGTYDVFKESKAELLLKSSLLKDKSLYKTPTISGRYYWPNGNFKVDDFDQYSDKIVLSGTNWLSTYWSLMPGWGGTNHLKTDTNSQWNKIQWTNQISDQKEYDVCAMFMYPSTKKFYEYQIRLDTHYDAFRKPCIDIAHSLNCNVAKLKDGIKVPKSEYERRLLNSKIIIAPFGAGEMAPRDIESAVCGAILIKPDMDYIETSPDILRKNETYIACKHDFSDLEEKVEQILGNYQDYHYIINNMRNAITEELSPEHLAMHLYNIFNNNVENVI